MKWFFRPGLLGRSFRRIWAVGRILGRAAMDLVDDRVFRMSAALAYYTVFSMAPMLIVITSICDFAFGRQVIEGRLYLQIRGLVGEQVALEIQDIIQHAIFYLHRNFSAEVIGFVALAFGATSVFAEIQDSINMIWRVRTRSTAGWWKVILNRLLSFGMVLSLGFILLVSLALDALMDTLGTELRSVFPGLAFFVAHSLNFGVSFLVTFLLFGTIFKVLPDAKIKWRDVSMGALVTTVLFLSGRYGIGYYLHSTHVASTYGAAGSLAVILLWVYYSALILYFGAEFTRVYTHFRGRSIRPNDYASRIRVVQED